MAISPGEFLDIEGVGDPVAVAQHNFEVANRRIYKFTPTYQNGAATTVIGPPTSGEHILDEKWVDAWGGTHRCTSAGTPGDWRQETPAIREGEPASGTIPTGYVILDADDNYRKKIHLGGYVWGFDTFGHLTGLTGGGGANLDGIATEDLEAGAIAQFLISGVLQTYRLKAGTNAEKSPHIVRPDDYASSTNEKVWERVERSTYPGFFFSTELTGLTGSTTADLNFIPTVDMTTGQCIAFVVSSAFVIYRLRAGTDATASPTVIRPIDFQSVTNPKVWERMLNISTPGDALISNNNLSEINTQAKRVSARTSLDVLGADDARGLIANDSPRGGLFLDGTSANKISGADGVDFGTGDFSFVFILTLHDSTPATAHTLFATHSSANNRVFIQLSSTNFILQFRDGSDATTDYTFAPDVTLEDGKTYFVAITADRDGNGTLYINGISDRDKSGSPITTSISGSSSVNIGSGNSGTWQCGANLLGVVSALSAHNYAMTAADVLRMAEMNRVAFADKWGTATALMDASTLNGGFETAGGGGADVFANWTETTGGTSTINRDTSDFNSGAASCRLDIDSSGNNAIITQSVLTVGKRYRVTFWAKGDIATTVRVSDGATTPSISLTTSWAQYSHVITNAGTTNLSFRQGTETGARSIWIDDVTITQSGALLDLDLSIGKGFYIPDRSSYNNWGTAAMSGTAHVIERRSGTYTVEKTLSFSDISSSAATTGLFTLPKNCAVISFQFDVTEAADAATTVDIGISGTADKYVNNADMDGTGLVYADSASKGIESSSANTSVYVQKSGATTTGIVRIVATIDIRGL